MDDALCRNATQHMARVATPHLEHSVRVRVRPWGGDGASVEQDYDEGRRRVRRTQGLQQHQLRPRQVERRRDRVRAAAAVVRLALGAVGLLARVEADGSDDDVGCEQVS